jgi:hypothetical protein
MDIINSISLVLRSAIYLWVGVESLFLHYLYNYGYQKFKPTPIIDTLHRFFFFLGVFFITISFIPIFGYSQPFATIEEFLVRNSAAFLALFIGFYLTKFRTESLKANPVKHPLLKKE